MAMNGDNYKPLLAQLPQLLATVGIFATVSTTTTIATIAIVATIVTIATVATIVSHGTIATVSGVSFSLKARHHFVPYYCQ